MLRRLFSRSVKIEDVPPLAEFMKSQASQIPLDTPNLMHSYQPISTNLNGLKYFLETYGCQMNENDSEIVRGILESAGLEKAESSENVRSI